MISVEQLGKVMNVIKVIGDTGDECNNSNIYVMYFIDMQWNLVRYYRNRQPALEDLSDVDDLCRLPFCVECAF